MKLTKEEKELMKSLEKDEWRSILNLKEEIISGLKIVLQFHPLPTLPPQGGGNSYNPLSPGGRGQG